MPRRCCDYSSVPPFREEPAILHPLKAEDYPLLIQTGGHRALRGIVDLPCPKYYPLLDPNDRIENYWSEFAESQV